MVWLWVFNENQTKQNKKNTQRRKMLKNHLFDREVRIKASWHQVFSLEEDVLNAKLTYLAELKPIAPPLIQPLTLYMGRVFPLIIQPWPLIFISNQALFFIVQHQAYQLDTDTSRISPDHETMNGILGIQINKKSYFASTPTQLAYNSGVAHFSPSVSTDVRVFVILTEFQQNE